MRTWVRIAVVVLLVLSGVAAPAVAQSDDEGGDGPILPEDGEIEDPGEGGDTDDSDDESGDSSDEESGTDEGGENTTDGSESGESGEDAPEGEGEGEGEDDGILPSMPSAPSLPSAGDWLEDAIDWTREDIEDGIAGYVDRLNAAFVGVAAPGEPLAPSSWIMPGGMFSVPAAFYVAAASMASVLWAGALVYLFDINSRQKQREVLRILLYAIFGTIFGMVLLGLYFNGINTISTGIAPSGAEFVADGASGYAQLGLGHVIVLILLAINAGVVVLGGVIMFGIYMLPLVLYAFFPFIVASKAVPVKPLQSTANLGLTTIALLPLLRFIQSLLLRLGDMMVWEAEGLGEQIASLLGTGLILAVALLLLPYIFYKNIETASGMALSTITVKHANRGAAKANDAASSAASRVGGRAKEAAAPYANRARSAANQKASNAKRRAGSRVGGAILDAKFGRPESSWSNRSTGGSSASTPTDSGAKMPDQARSTTSPAANQSRPARQRAMNRQRRNAKKRRSQRGD